ncbi:Hypothetical predicted protein [Paramuricea clavata]|uniref:Uncharacterized protein n=1 Tax=Paramuricea clavata TaxID=317549 RepID=A0A7D9EJ86_PARCT|nr:Hypothetical predicted protein [Paramuricea clavata]
MAKKLSKAPRIPVPRQAITIQPANSSSSDEHDAPPRRGLGNGVANCSRHTIECMVRALHDRRVDDGGRTQDRSDAVDQLQDDLNDMQYGLYAEPLAQCGCDECTACIQFDESYNAFYDQLKENDYNAPPPRFSDCSLHCVDNEMKALNLKSKFAGFGSSSLENAYHFAQSTAPMTPPNLSTAAPTGVMGSTTKYMVPYLRSRKL